MKLFFDTSALVKYFQREDGSDEVQALIDDQANEVWALSLALLELHSSLFRRSRSRELTDDEVKEVWSCVTEVATGFNIESTSEAIITEAHNLLLRFGKKPGLRSLDAIHLAGLSLLGEKTWRVVACDTVVCEVARNMGYKVINPAPAKPNQPAPKIV